METLGSMNDFAYHFFEDLGCKISDVSGDSQEGSLISSGCQSQSSILTRPFHKSFTRHNDPDL